MLNNRMKSIIIGLMGFCLLSPQSQTFAETATTAKVASSASETATALVPPPTTITPLPAITPTTVTSDKMLKVGLLYGTVKDTSPLIKSDSGFKFGLYESDLFLPLLNFQTSKELVIYKNGFSENETLLTSPTGSVPLANGKYHIQIGATQQTYDQMRFILDKVRSVDPTAFPAYDGGWRVYIGAYYTEAQYNENFMSLTSKMMPFDISRAPFNYSAFMVLENNAVKLLFATTDTNFAFQSYTEGSTISYNKYKYRGGLVFKRFKDSDPTIINYLPVQQYLYGVLPYEISPKWPIEAQKAQAIAARNYAVSNLNKHKKHGFDICNTVDCQMYVGANVETPLSNQAVDLTNGIYLKYNGKLANTVYHSNSGGRTENSENLWTTAIPYLIGVDDPYSIGSPNDVWTTSYTAAQLTQFLIAKKMDIGDVTDVFVEQYSINGRSLKTTFVGTKGRASFDKDKIRSVFPESKVKTNYFTIVKPGGTPIATSEGVSNVTAPNLVVQSAEQTSIINTSNPVVVINENTSSVLQPGSALYQINGKGWGHGVGMSQWGSKKMAELGFTYDQILTYYYQNTYLEITN